MQAPDVDREPALEFVLQLPDEPLAGAALPVLLALPPGDQSRTMVEAGMSRDWAAEARARGWAVVSPIAPAGGSFAGQNDELLAELLDHVETLVDVEGGRFHVAGPSNGGRSAFHFAALHPERIASLLVLPGFPPTDSDAGRLAHLLDVPIAMWVGGDDERWLTASRSAHGALVGLGHPMVSLEVLEGEGHQPQSVTGEVLFERLQTFHDVLVREAEQRRAVGDVLDDFHRAASEADGARYFAHFGPGAVFLGTDANERWTIPEFRLYAEPHFDAGRGWTYVARERFVDVDFDGHTAWFDERLDNAKYGEVRGTGVLRRFDDTWRIVQYNLALPVPNELMESFVDRIRSR
jgi:pimeloyl-ACP methyl ester carboxylesterase